MIESFVDAMKVYDNMCDHFLKDGDDCSDCPLCQNEEARDCIDSECVLFMSANPKEALSKINKYAQDNNLKTRMQDFFEKHPNAEKRTNGVPYVCAKNCGYEYMCEIPLGIGMTCDRCWGEFM